MLQKPSNKKQNVKKNCNKCCLSEYEITAIFKCKNDGILY